MTETTPTPILDEIAATGTGYGPRQIRCADNAVISLAAGPGHYCLPRPRRYGLGDAPADYTGPFTEIEAYPIKGITLAEAPDLFYEGDPAAVRTPVDTIRALILAHGGEHAEQAEFVAVRSLTIGGAR